MEHVTQEMLDRLARRELGPNEIRTALRHIGGCDECARRASLPLEARIDSLAADLTADDGITAHLDPESELMAYVDGTMPAAERELAESHLEECAMCRAEVADLGELRQTLAAQRRRPKGRPRWPLAVAAAVAAVLMLLLLITRRDTVEPHVTPPTASAPITAPATTSQVVENEPVYASTEWNRLVRTALTTARLPFPSDLALLETSPDILRGGSNGVLATVWPSGVVVDDPRPRFLWPEREGATYVVSVFDEGREVLASGPLTTAAWTPPRPLARGHTYSWEVQVTRGTAAEILPASPAPPARFRIASASDHAQLEDARRDHPGDPILHAVLAARAGLRAEAMAALRQGAKAGNEDARRLLAAEEVKR